MCVYVYIHIYTDPCTQIYRTSERTSDSSFLYSAQDIYSAYPGRILVTDHQQSSPLGINSISQKLTRENLGHLRLPSSSKICRFSAPFRTLSISKGEDAWRDPCCRAGSGAGQSGACVDLGATLLGRILERDRGHDPLLGPGQPVAED